MTHNTIVTVLSESFAKSLVTRVGSIWATKRVSNDCCIHISAVVGGCVASLGRNNLTLNKLGSVCTVQHFWHLRSVIVIVKGQLNKLRYIICNRSWSRYRAWGIVHSTSLKHRYSTITIDHARCPTAYPAPARTEQRPITAIDHART